MKILLQASRIIVGVLFIFSGLIKANDPAGLSYKMQEFFEVWGLHGLNDYTLAFSILMIGFEIIAGIAVLIGWQFNFFSWMLLLLIIFFTFLTGYALLSGKIRECGCFGDCIKLTAGQSFIKDLILLALILVLFVKRKSIKPFHGSKIPMLLLLLTSVMAFVFQFYVLTYLPVVDCLPYKVGNNIPEKMKIPAGSLPDSTVINFVYKKGGAEIEFDADHFPADFNDSLYQFVKRYDKVVRAGNAQPPIKDFVIISPAGTDTTMAILQQSGFQFIIFSKTAPKDVKDWTWMPVFKSIQLAAKEKQIPLIWVSADAENTASSLSKLQVEGVPVMRGDLVAIKTAARVDPTLYLLKDGTIQGKWSYAKLDKVAPLLWTK
jgi:uncharacterized membrane protein YphA (DoxX/SURF4 family)